MVGFESLTQGVMVLAVHSMHYLLFMQPNHFSGLVGFYFPSRLQLVHLLSLVYYWN